MGRSGCGKGTQAKLLDEEITSRGISNSDILHIVTGDLFRKFTQSDGPTHARLNEVMSKGEKPPEFLSVAMWGELLMRDYRPNMHLFIDGTPRSVPEAYTLENALLFYKRTPIDVINIEVSDEWATERLLGRGRHDDKATDSIKGRLNFYRTDVAPALEYFRTSTHITVFDINGEQSIEKVHADIKSVLKLI